MGIARRCRTNDPENHTRHVFPLALLAMSDQSVKHPDGQTHAIQNTLPQAGTYIPVEFVTDIALGGPSRVPRQGQPFYASRISVTLWTPAARVKLNVWKCVHNVTDCGVDLSEHRLDLRVVAIACRSALKISPHEPQIRQRMSIGRCVIRAGLICTRLLRTRIHASHEC